MKATREKVIKLRDNLEESLKTLKGLFSSQNEKLSEVTKLKSENEKKLEEILARLTESQQKNAEDYKKKIEEQEKAHATKLEDEKKKILDALNLQQQNQPPDDAQEENKQEKPSNLQILATNPKLEQLV